jgi:kumamolisin
VKVSGSAGAVEKAFNIQLNHYRAQDGRLFRANNTEPMIPASLVPHLGAILGLNDMAGLWHSHLQRFPASAATSSPSLSGTTGPGGGLAPDDIKAVYGLTGTPLTGAGQTLALYELDGYRPSDITTYENHFGLPAIAVTPISVDGASNVCGSGCSEVELDIEVAAALAPGLSQILVYEGPPLPGTTYKNVLDIYDKIATDDLAQTISTSWGGPEELLDVTLKNIGSFLQAESLIFQRMAAQGQSFYAASGDSGAYDDGSTLSVDDPASQPFVTAVGGTQLSGSVTTPVEVTWNGCGTGPCLQSSYGSGGGGVSAIWPISGSVSGMSYDYQVGVTGTPASQTQRNVPDVALCAGAPGYSVYIGGWQLFGGTSAAAPLWAALTALLNQSRATGGTGPLGFANPTLYQLASGGSYSTIFNDITAGDNGSYTASTGYDNTTGLGSFKGQAFINTVGLLPTGTSLPVKLASVYAFPNPWDARNSKHVGNPINFKNVPAGATVKIFTLSGFFVKSLTSTGGLTPWDMTNDAGKSVASGLYFFLASNGVDTTKGTIAIIK